jgi:hypothetical protein
MKSVQKYLWLHFSVGYTLSKTMDFSFKEISSNWKKPVARLAKISGWLVHDLSHRLETEWAENRKRLWCSAPH